jgi:hypothetical protein
MAAVAQAQQVVAANAQESLSCVKSLLKLVRVAPPAPVRATAARKLAAWR